MDEWFRNAMPESPITKSYCAACAATTAACALNVVHPVVLYFDVDLILRGELWRILTNFLFFGTLGLNSLLQLYFLAKPCC